MQEVQVQEFMECNKMQEMRIQTLEAKEEGKEGEISAGNSSDPHDKGLGGIWI
jgi:hypothetical protein